MTSFRRDDRGVAILELALVAPLLILLAIGIIEIGLYTRVSIEVGNAARAGVQYGAQGTTTSIDSPGIASAAALDANEVSTLGVTSTTFCTCGATPGTHVALCTPTPACATGDHLAHFVSVTTSKKFTPLIAIAGIPSTMTITRTASQEISP